MKIVNNKENHSTVISEHFRCDFPQWRVQFSVGWPVLPKGLSVFEKPLLSVMQDSASFLSCRFTRRHQNIQDIGRQLNPKLQHFSLGATNPPKMHIRNARMVYSKKQSNKPIKTFGPSNDYNRRSRNLNTCSNDRCFPALLCMNCFEVISNELWQVMRNRLQRKVWVLSAIEHSLISSATPKYSVSFCSRMQSDAMRNGSIACKYMYKTCSYPRSLKANGRLHNFCEIHRYKANASQRAYVSKHVKATKIKEPKALMRAVDSGLFVEIESFGRDSLDFKKEMPLDEFLDVLFAIEPASSVEPVSVFESMSLIKPPSSIEPVSSIEPMSLNSPRPCQPIEPDILSVILAL